MCSDCPVTLGPAPTRGPLTHADILAMASKLAPNGLRPGAEVYAPDHLIDELRAEGVNAVPVPVCDCDAPPMPELP